MKGEEIIDTLRTCGVSDHKIKVLTPIIHNVAWMREQLDTERNNIVGGLVIDYDNGGGQSGIRENPHFKAYESLWKSYMIGMGKILDAMPKEAVVADDEPVAPKSVLALVRERHGKGA